jgi:hypothetical protein
MGQITQWALANKAQKKIREGGRTTKIPTAVMRHMTALYDITNPIHTEMVRRINASMDKYGIHGPNIPGVPGLDELEQQIHDTARYYGLNVYLSTRQETERFGVGKKAAKSFFKIAQLYKQQNAKQSKP